MRCPQEESEGEGGLDQWTPNDHQPRGSPARKGHRKVGEAKLPCQVLVRGLSQSLEALACQQVLEQGLPRDLEAPEDAKVFGDNGKCQKPFYGICP